MTRYLTDAAKLIDARSSRSTQRKVGASDIGVCRRRAGYVHHRTEVSNPENLTGLPAVVGTWIHKGALSTMQRLWGTVIETRVEDDLLRGHVDGLDLPNDLRVKAGLPENEWAPDVVEVDDLKTKRDARAVDYVRNRGPKRSELFQVHLYSDLIRRGKIKPIQRQARLAELGPLEVETVRLRYFPRTGEEREASAEFVHTQPFDPDIAAEAWSWVEQVSRSTRPEDLPRDEDGPGLSVACDHCPFRRECWGEEDGAAPQSQLIVTDADLARVLRAYDVARTDERDAKHRKDVARATLDATAPAIYVNPQDDTAYRLGWSGGNVRDPEIDYEALLERFRQMQALYREADLEVPEIPYKDRGPSARTIAVTVWDPPEPLCGKPVGDPEAFAWLAPPGDDRRWWVQNRPRGGWTGYEDADLAADETALELTAGAFAKRFPSYVEERARCIHKRGHSGDCVPPDVVVELDTEGLADLDHDDWPDVDLTG
jgi:hypothetical protein